MTAPLRIGIAGLGTVGGGVVNSLRGEAGKLAERAGRPIEIAAVSARDRHKKRDINLTGLRWVDDPLALASDPSIDVVVETIGGEEGVARALVMKALENGKSVVTANKALLAKHGVELAKIAEAHGAVLAFEASVAGGIPVIKTLREGLTGNRIRRITGILNGTCNYILTTMWQRKCSFEEALKEAQARGFAEADPSLDIDGGDTAHKLAILASLAYGVQPATGNISIEGIRRVTPYDMEFSDRLGYAVKLLGIAEKTDHGVELRVHPGLVKKDSQLGTVAGADNAVLFEGDAGPVFQEGRGAGREPTASSIVADLMQIAQGAKYKPFGVAAASLAAPSPGRGLSQLSSEYYIRFEVKDEPGVLAAILEIFRDNGISVDSANQPPGQGKAVRLAITTHETSESSMQKAIGQIKKLGTVTQDPYMIRIGPVTRH